MDLLKRFEIDFGKNFQNLQYKGQYKKSGELTSYTFLAVHNLKDYVQFSAVICDVLDENYRKIPSTLIALQLTDEPGTYSYYTLSSHEPPFISIPHTNNLYIYCNECNIDRKELNDFFLKHKLRVILRDKKYFDMQKADFFISHDSRDKQSVAKPLSDELIKRGYKVWYDEYSLKIGDSLTESIEKGIIDSKHGILILSKNFLSNEKWAKNELQSLKTKQIITNDKVLLPIWHEIDEKDLLENFWLLDKKGGNTNNGIIALADEIEAAYNS
ncbi:toll/interleukin-1 receptor domain-containing protein [Chryseobacterium sp. CFBP8996]|uniref:toll/interleukin-1 receptor domain-containing protein n=1 Tax=Chryseobacterium sp. CFBP8996 TaxID=3096529 RepID=UPI002A6B3624|nr:toll/interleukin-1 receptor domain-containing protein [Chryseobacterium sp. CFBP8996]MDY0932726.1 toll/interleukin-1 receptor domain-containing protein [Chryseobacterium sp. CFBP8996]